MIEKRITVTQEMRDDAKKCKCQCINCSMYETMVKLGGNGKSSCLEFFAGLPYVWEKAPEWATTARVMFTGKKDGTGFAEYQRPPKKTEKERVIEEVKEVIGKLSEDGVISISTEKHTRNGVTEMTIKILR